MGQFSTFLAGPWGAAILIAGVALGPLIQNLLGFGDAADEGKAKAYDFSNGLNGLTISANEGAAAFAQLAQEIRGAIAVQGDFLQSKAIAASQAAREWTDLANRENAELKALKARTTDANPFNNLSPAEIYRMNALASNQAKLQAGIAKARDGEVNADIALRQQRALEKADPRTAIGGQYKRDMGALEIRRRASREREANDPLAASTLPGYISGDQYEAEVTRLTAAKKKAEEALKPDKKGRKGADPAKEAERAAKAAVRLGEFSEDASKKIANIRDGFSDIPPEVERVNRATRELDDIISDLSNRKPVGFENSIAEAQALKAALPDMAINRVMREITEEAQQQVQYQMLILQGRDGEAQALQVIAQKEQQFGELTRERKEQIIATGIAMQRINEEMQRASEIQAVFLDATRAVRGEVEAILGGYGSLGDLGKTLRRSFQNIQGKLLTEQIFGDVFRDMDRYVKEKTGIGSSVDMLKTETERAGKAATDFADTLVNATRTILGGGSAAGGVVAGASAASAWGNMRIPDGIRLPGYDLDPNGPLVAAGAVKADTKRTITDLSPEEFFYQMGQKVGAEWAARLEPLLGKKLAGNLGGVLGGVLEGQATTGTGFGAILGGLKEIKGLPKGITDALGGAFGGAQQGAQIAGLGNALGIKMSNTGAQIGGAIGSFIPIPGGQIIGSIAGGLIGNLFKTVKSGYAQVRNGEVVGTYGRTGSLQNDAAEAAGGLVDTIASLAKTLRTTLGDYDFDFGKKDDKYVVNTGVRGVFNFDSEQAAMEFAVREAVADGAFIGMKDAQKRLIMANGDLEAQVEKAVKFGDVFKQLRAIKDPVGAAIEELNTEFSGLIDIFKEAGASASESASLEELYGLKRADAIKQANETILSSLKGLQQSLTIGSDYLSLRDRKSAALEVFNPLAERVKAGDTTAFNDYADAANSLLDIERQISGSTSAFFDVFNQIKGITDSAISGQNNITSIATASDSPFASLATQQQATTSAIDNQTTALIEALGGRIDTLNDNLINAIRSMVASGNTSNVSALLNSNGYW